MSLAMKILGLWVPLSCTLGPCLTWLFFYGERQGKQAKRVACLPGSHHLHEGLIAAEVRPDISASPAVCRADEPWLEIGQPYVVGPSIVAHDDEVASPVVGAID
jgi:hypothetical protein